MHRRLVVLLAAVAMTLVVARAIAAPNAQDATASPGAGTPTGSPEASPVVALVGDPANGQALTTQCMACHTVNGAPLVGPTWKGLYGHEVELEDGTKVIADDAYIAQSIREPLSQIVKGFAPSMPPYPQFTDQEIADIIAYIKTLE
jgi:cytochrome c oxidase subunit 2